MSQPKLVVTSGNDSCPVASCTFKYQTSSATCADITNPADPLTFFKYTAQTVTPIQLITDSVNEGLFYGCFVCQTQDGTGKYSTEVFKIEIFSPTELNENAFSVAWFLNNIDTFYGYWNEFRTFFDTYLYEYVIKKWFLPVAGGLLAVGNMAFVTYNSTGTNQIAVIATVLKNTFRDQDFGIISLYGILDLIIDMTSRNSDSGGIFEIGDGGLPFGLNLEEILIPLIQSLIG